MALGIGPPIGAFGGGGAIEEVLVPVLNHQLGFYQLGSFEVPAGETWRVMVNGDLTTPGTMNSSGGPKFWIGNVASVWIQESGWKNFEAEVQGPATVRLEVRWRHSNGTGFSGRVWGVRI